ncbi:serine protease inhibitor 3/4-like [Ostrinia furnacalis]|uniref:serine protease inhibitor 3/4-like n=1 Tax=Ostrinia furnacalis TaxID=93504 RepID=UPI0010409643|nr:serine protease inhibitor 3/4-like [Ostrinia furnacalis]
MNILFLVYHSISFTAAMDAKQLASSIAQFSAKFCNELDKNKSVVSSPLSAEILLALLTLGTTEPAHDELLTALGIPDDASIRSGFSVVSDKLKSIKGVTLNVANKVYVMEGAYDLHSELKQDAIKVFDAGFEKVNFEESAAAASLINKWIGIAPGTIIINNGLQSSHIAKVYAFIQVKRLATIYGTKYRSHLKQNETKNRKSRNLA